MSSELNSHPLPDSRVVVVGAGPSGTATALALARAGVHDVTLLDAHDFPRDKTCGSALSSRGIAVAKHLGVWDRIAAEAYPIHGLRLVTPGGHDAYLSAGGTAVQAVICLRRHMDYEVLKAALEAGVRFVPNFRARGPVLDGDRWIGVESTDGRIAKGDFVVVANGAHSTFVRDTRPKRIIHTIMGWWSGVEFKPHHLEMVYDSLIAPYYGWLFPEGEDRVNIGITYEDDERPLNARERFAQFLDKYYGERLRNAEQIGGFKGHPISYTYNIRDLYSPGRVIVGEAGRMTHPATGEGIYQAMQSGVFAAEALADILLRGASETAAFRRYERRCVTRFTGSFLAGGVFRRLAKTPALDWLVGVTETKAVKNTAAVVLAHL